MRGGVASAVAGGLRCSPELIRALKPRPGFLGWLLMVLWFPTPSLSTLEETQAVPRLFFSKMFHEKSKGLRV